MTRRERIDLEDALLARACWMTTEEAAWFACVPFRRAAACLASLRRRGLVYSPAPGLWRPGPTARLSIGPVAVSPSEATVTVMIRLE